MDAYLDYLLHKSWQITAGSVHYVIGNESADLDSILSSLCCAFYLHTTNAGSYPVHFVPVVNIRRHDMALRREALALFTQCNLAIDSLVYVEDISLTESDDFNVTLVDHNCAVWPLEHINKRVVRILDHHVDSNKIDITDKTINMFGSCCTLVAQFILNQTTNFFQDNQVVADLLLSGIHIDTAYLQPDNGRTTMDDVTTAKNLVQYCTTDPKTLYDQLSTAKFDMASMTTAQVLMKDYKSADTAGGLHIGISSATMRLHDLVHRDDLFVQCTVFCEQTKRIQALVVMFLTMDPESDEAVRDLVVFSQREDLVHSIGGYLEGFEEQLALECSLNAVVVSADAQKNFRIYHQRNVKSSRKVVLPLLLKMP